MLVKLIVSGILFMSYVRAELPGYVCVKAGGTCGHGRGGIDIRRITGGTVCPPGELPCLIPTTVSPTPLLTMCGRRNVHNLNTWDGFTTAGAYPWQAFLMNRTSYIGSGALVSANVIITAAHKVYQYRTNPSEIRVYMGVHSPSDLGTHLDVAAVTIHLNYNPETYFNDIAVLILQRPIVPLPTHHVNTVCLPTPDQVFEGKTCTVSGWGQTDFHSPDAPTMFQKQTNLTIVSHTTCYKSMSDPALLGSNVRKYLDPIGEICAGGELSRDACTNDGGSPLVCYINNAYYVAGLVIWGKGCGQSGRYGVYVYIPRYLTWIQSVIAQTG